MRISIIGTVLFIAMGVACALIFPIAQQDMIAYQRTQDVTLSDVRNLIDEVIDTRKLTKDMVADFNLRLAAQDVLLQATITREVKVINPDPLHPGETYTRYLVADDTSTYNQGDIITITVKQVGQSFYSSITQRMLGTTNEMQDIILSGRVR